jgi:hypothetical protein
MTAAAEVQLEIATNGYAIVPGLLGEPTLTAARDQLGEPGSTAPGPAGCGRRSP